MKVGLQSVKTSQRRLLSMLVFIRNCKQSHDRIIIEDKKGGQRKGYPDPYQTFHPEFNELLFISIALKLNQNFVDSLMIRTQGSNATSPRCRCHAISEGVFRLLPTMFAHPVSGWDLSPLVCRAAMGSSTSTRRRIYLNSRSPDVRRSSA